jgi:hypothetical protein
MRNGSHRWRPRQSPRQWPSPITPVEWIRLGVLVTLEVVRTLTGIGN